MSYTTKQVPWIEKITADHTDETVEKQKKTIVNGKMKVVNSSSNVDDKVDQNCKRDKYD